MNGPDTVVRFFHDVDRQDWSALRAGLDDAVLIDYTSLFGGTVEKISADELLSRWQSLLPGFDTTQHILGPLTPAIRPESLSLRAEAPGETRWWECNVRAHHRLYADGSDREWLVAGRYAIGARPDGDDWLISAIVLDTAYQDGDPTLTERATRIAEDRANHS